MNVKRFLGNIAKTYLAIGALSVSAYAGADEFYNHPQNWGCCPQPCCPQPCCQPCCPPPPCCEPPACAWGYNPPAYLRCGKDCCDSFVDGLGIRADFLWWRPQTECLTLGSEEVVVREPTTLLGSGTENFSHYKKPKFKYDPGFRLGITHNCDSCCCSWDVALTWTHFHSKANTSGESFFEDDVFDEGDFTVFVPQWERVDNAFPDFAKSRWTFDLDLIDLEFGHKYYVSQCFVLRPHVGLRGGRINQGYRVFSFANRTELELGDFDNYESFVHAKNDFLAIGPRVGVDLELNLGCGFAVVGQAAGSILFGRAQKHAHEDFNYFEDVGTVSQESNLHYRCNGSDHRQSRAITDLAIGVKWEHCFCWCNHYHPVSLALLWEHHGFWDYNDFSFAHSGFDLTLEDENPVHTTHKRYATDIFTQGLTVALNVGF